MCDAVEQAIELAALTDTVYQQVPPIAGSSIGKHIRHIVDHLANYRSGMASGCIDYNARSRESETERQPLIAMNQLKAFSEWLLSAADECVALSIVTEVSTSDNISVRLPSSSHRELVYLINHTYHHIAHASLLAKSMDVKMPEHLGIAPATASYMRESAALCAQ
jgi:uncharacterized damage-inducible protein DinB